MAIVHARVDERLIHGQVAMVWCRVTGCQRIVVANNEAVKDKMMSNALIMSKPAGIKLSILSVSKALEKLTSEAYGDENILLITKSIQDMKTLLDNGLKLTGFNVGNVAGKNDSVMIKKSVWLTQDEIMQLRELINRNIKITAQMLPNEPDCSIESYLE